MEQQHRLRIAIDGPAGSGKGTVGALLAERLGYLFIDTGAMYRAVALLAVQAGLDLTDDLAVGAPAEKATIEFQHSARARPHGYATLLNGVDVSEDIRSPEIDVASSRVAVLPRVRNALVKKQKQFAQAGGVVMEGRDIATVVMPDADVKIYLTASVEERARRRYVQRVARGLSASMNELIAELAERDRRDSERTFGPLIRLPDAFVSDSSGLTPGETVTQLESEIRRRFPEINIHPECAVRAVIVNSQGQVLLIRSSKKWQGIYVFPGGRVQPYETLEAALHREVKEEVGLDICVHRFVEVTEDIVPPSCRKGEMPHHLVLVDFLCEATSLEVQVDGSEAEEYVWRYPAEILSSQTTDSTYSLLQRIQNEIAAVLSQELGDGAVIYEKLVRDNIPNLLKCSGEQVRCREAASDEEYEHFLRLKLVEEAGEFATSGDIEEIVDVLEVLDALLELKGINAEDLAQLKRRKVAKRGRFGKRLVLEVGGE